MTTKELKIKLKISENTGIHCPTLELAKKVLDIFRQLGLKWYDETNYTKHTYWDEYKKNTVYCPFEGDISSLRFANFTNCKIINAEEFIALHTENKEFNLENYEPKGDLIGFPKEIIAKMLDCQEEQGNKRDVTVFEENKFSAKLEDGFDWNETKEEYWFWEEVIRKRNFSLFFKKYPKQDNQDNSQEFNLENYVPKGELTGFPKEIIAKILACQEEQSNKRDVSVFEKNRYATMYNGGFDWNLSKEGQYFWNEVISHKNFDVFFEKYPKKDNQYNSQEFKLGDKVYDILLKEVGVVQDIVHSSSIPYGLSVEFKSGVKSYTINGCYIPEYKNPHLLHYRDDYNYDIIDFNNLPQRQELKRWRAKVEETYYSLSSNFKIEQHYEDNDSFNDEAYDSGNYFQTKEQAQEVVDKLKEYFKQLINNKEIKINEPSELRCKK